jgi:hypothetical protein
MKAVHDAVVALLVAVGQLPGAIGHYAVVGAVDLGTYTSIVDGDQ